MRNIKSESTSRGFSRVEFDDLYGARCSLQKSSLASQDAIWLGTNDAKRHHVTGEIIGTRMHLTQEDVVWLLPILQHFAETGDLPDTLKPEKVFFRPAEANRYEGPCPKCGNDYDPMHACKCYGRPDMFLVSLIQAIEFKLIEAKLLIGGNNDTLRPAVREANVNKAWHLLTATEVIVEKAKGVALGSDEVRLADNAPPENEQPF